MVGAGVGNEKDSDSDFAIEQDSGIPLGVGAVVNQNGRNALSTVQHAPAVRIIFHSRPRGVQASIGGGLEQGAGIASAFPKVIEGEFFPRFETGVDRAGRTVECRVVGILTCGSKWWPGVPAVFRYRRTMTLRLIALWRAEARLLDRYAERSKNLVDHQALPTFAGHFFEHCSGNNVAGIGVEIPGTRLGDWLFCECPAGDLQPLLGKFPTVGEDAFLFLSRGICRQTGGVIEQLAEGDFGGGAIHVDDQSRQRLGHRGVKTDLGFVDENGGHRCRHRLGVGTQVPEAVETHWGVSVDAQGPVDVVGEGVAVHIKNQCANSGKLKFFPRIPDGGRDRRGKCFIAVDRGFDRWRRLREADIHARGGAYTGHEQGERAGRVFSWVVSDQIRDWSRDQRPVPTYWAEAPLHSATSLPFLGFLLRS